MRGTPPTRATMLTPKLVCSGVDFQRLLSTTSGFASRFSVITKRVSSPDDSSLTSAMPSSSRALTSSEILRATAPAETW